MKFLAMLQDSLREAVDSKVFYVMVGLSLLLTLVALTVTFTPTASGDHVMQLAAMPLNLDEDDLEAIKRDPQEFTRRVMGQALEGKRRVFYNFESARPAGGAPDAPGSPFLVTISATYLFPDDARNAGASGAADHILRSFGAFGDLRIVEATDVRLAARPEDSGPSGLPFLAQNLLAGVGLRIDPADVTPPFLAQPRTFTFEVTTRPTAATARFWSHTMSVFFGALPIGGEDAALPLFFWVYILEAGIVAGVGAWVTIVTSVVLTSFFVPNMLRKGTVDMLVVKPIRRITLLVYKYVGGLTFIFLNTTLAIGGVWLALGLRSGQWPTGFLVMILVITFFFAILYSVSTLAGVLTRSPVVAIVATCAAWFVLFLVGLGYDWFERARARDEEFVRMQQKQEKELGGAPLPPAPQPPPPRPGGEMSGPPTHRDTSYQGWFAKLVYAVHYVLPRTADIDKLSDQLLLRDLAFAGIAGEKKPGEAPFAWAESLTVSLAFIAVMLGIACWWFATKDY